MRSTASGSSSCDDPCGDREVARPTPQACRAPPRAAHTRRRGRRRSRKNRWCATADPDFSRPEPRDARSSAPARALSARRGGGSRPLSVTGPGSARPVHGPVVAHRGLRPGHALRRPDLQTARPHHRHARDDPPRHWGRRARPPAARPAGARRRAVRHRDFAPLLRGVDLEPVLAYARSALGERPLTGPQLRAALAERFPLHDAAALGYACRCKLALVQVPPRGVWGEAAQVTVATAESWLGKPLDRSASRSTSSSSATSPRSGQRSSRTS